MSYIAKIDYEGFTPKQIRDLLKNGEDITMTDASYQIIETVR